MKTTREKNLYLNKNINVAVNTDAQIMLLITLKDSVAGPIF